MTWAEYYERYDGWQESTQYSRLASIKDFGPDESPSEEICDCIQYVDTRTATSILRRALAAGVRFRAAEVAEIADSGQIEDEEALEKLSEEALAQIDDKGYDFEMREDGVENISKFGIAFSGKKVVIKTTDEIDSDTFVVIEPRH